MSDDTGRLASLEAENFALRSELDRLRPPPPPPPAIDGPFRLPSAPQMERLIAAVLLRYPSLRYRDIDDAEFLKMVTTGFRFLSTLPRTPGKLENRYDLLSWCAHAAEAFRTIGLPCSLRGSSLHVAAIAAGDIPYLPPRLFPAAGFGVCLLGITRDTRPAANRWLRVLDHCFDESLVIEPPAGRTFNPLSKIFDLTPVNISPRGDWRNEL